MPPDTLETPPLGAPTSAAPFSVKVTCPVLPTAGLLATVAVNVTELSFIAFGNGFELTVTVVGCPVAGWIFRHQPPVKLVVSPVPEALYRKSVQAPWAAAPTNEV